MPLRLDVIDAIDGLVGQDGFFNSDNRDELYAVMTEMLDNGIGLETAISWTSRAFNAGCDEYGG